MLSSLFVLLFAVSPSLACSPVPGPEPTVPELYKRADFVFLAEALPGTETGKDKPGGLNIALRVRKVWKGKPEGEVRYGQHKFGTCGFSLQEGGIYLLFAGKDKDGLFASSAFTGSADIQQSGPALRALVRMEKEKKEIRAEAEDAKNLAGGVPPYEKYSDCYGTGAGGPACFSKANACFMVQDVKLRAECYARQSQAIAKELGFTL